MRLGAAESASVRVAVSYPCPRLRPRTRLGCKGSGPQRRRFAVVLAGIFDAAVDAARCRITPYLDQGGAAYAAPGLALPAPGSALGRPARRARAVLSLSVPPIFHAYSSRHAVQQRPRPPRFRLSSSRPPRPGRLRRRCAIGMRRPRTRRPLAGGSRLREGRDGAVKRDSS